jgi:hypothetical protein
MTMNCSIHPDRPATAYCRTCGRALCSEDQRDVYGVIYCQDCLARHVAPGAVPGIPPLQPPAVPGSPNPGLALALGFIPGVGAIYNGQYMKAIMEVLVFGFLVYTSNLGGALGTLFGLGAAAFYFFMVIDSYRTARALSLGQPVEEIPGFGPAHFNVPVGAAILIFFGIYLLLRTMNVNLPDISKFFWPVVLILIGARMLMRRAHVEEREPRT